MPNFCRSSCQLIRSSSMLTFVRIFTRLPSCPVLSYVVKTVFMVTTLKQNKIFPIEKSNFTTTKKCETDKQKVKTTSSFSFTSRGLCTKKSFQQAKQSTESSVMFFSNCIKICEDKAPNFGNKRTGYCITITHHLILPCSSWI